MSDRRRTREPGAEASTARGPYRLRLVLAVLTVPVSIAIGALFLANQAEGPWSPAAMTAAAGICFAVALVAVVDIAVIVRRRPRRDRGAR